MSPPLDRGAADGPRRAQDAPFVASPLTAERGQRFDAESAAGGHYLPVDLPPVGALDRQGGGPDDNAAQAGHLIVAPTLTSRYAKGGDRSATDALVESETEVSRSLNAGSRYDGDTETFVPVVANTLKGQRGKGGGGLGPEETLIIDRNSDGNDYLSAEAPTLRDPRHQVWVAPGEPEVADTVRSHPRPGSNSSGNIVAVGGDVTHALTSEGADASEDGTGRGTPIVSLPVADTLTSGSHPGSNAPGRRREDDTNIVAFLPTGGGAKGLSPTEDQSPGTGVGNGGTVAVAFHQTQDPISTEEGSSALGVSSHGMGVMTEDDDDEPLMVARRGVRRLTPTECERLMGWPDGWTAPKGVRATDSRRYAACGDGVVANVSEWIGRRIAAIEAANRAR